MNQILNENEVVSEIRELTDDELAAVAGGVDWLLVACAASPVVALAAGIGYSVGRWGPK